MSDIIVCKFCEKVAPEYGKKYCAECAKLGDEAIDEIFGSEDVLNQFLEKLIK